MIRRWPCVYAVALCAFVRAASVSAQEAPPPDASAAAAPPTAAPSAAEAEEDPATERAASRAVEEHTDDDAPDPVADEGERSGSAEGEPLGDNAPLANELAALSDRACLRALQRARVPFERVNGSVGGVATPVRLRGAIGGVSYRSAERHEVNELMDCRLAAALVRFSRLVRALGVHEVVHYSTYRPAGRRAVESQPLQSRHPGGLAIDAAVFHFDDGRRLSILGSFHGHRGRPVCGPEARVPRDDEARVLRSVACDSARRGIFHVVLTPNHNAAHRNHLHLEVTRGVSWQYVH